MEAENSAIIPRAKNCGLGASAKPKLDGKMTKKIAEQNEQWMKNELKTRALQQQQQERGQVRL
jgi:hypothetical protein